jgi:Lambda phage tail tape-measure protein (Tape_meas_lam_C)
MNILGSLFVELKANTGAFVDGMTKASYSAKAAGREIEESLSHLGGIAGSLLSPFGEFGRVVGESFEKAAIWSGTASSGIGKFAGGLTPLAVGAGAVAAAIAAVEVAAVGLAIHTAEAAARMLVMSQSTGVSVETLSGFAFAAKMSGVESSAMETGLSKLSKSILTAATAAPGATNAFTRLKVAVKENGEIRETGAIVLDLADKFSKMSEGAAKVGLARDLFGKGGAAMVPFLNQGREGIQAFLDTAQALGIILDTETAEASHRFEQNLHTIEAAGQGLSLRLTKELLPALEATSKALVDGLKDKNSILNGLVDGIAWLVKATIGLGQTFWTVFEQISIGARSALTSFLTLAGVWATAAKAMITGDWSGVGQAVKDGLSTAKGNLDLFLNDSKKLWKDNADFIENTMGPRAPWTVDHSHDKDGFHPDLKPAKEDTVLERVKERIAALQREAAEWFKVGSAGSQAEALIAEATKKGADEYGKLREQAAKSKTPAAMEFVTSNESSIETAASVSVYGAAVKSLTSELDKQGLTFKEEESAALAMAAAYRTGGEAIAAASVDKEFSKQRGQIEVLSTVHSTLAAQLGAEAPIVQFLAAAVDLENKKLAENEGARRRILSAGVSTELAKETAEYEALQPFITAVADAHLRGADAVREATVAFQLENWIQGELAKGIIVTDDQIAAQRDLLKGKSDDVYAGSIKEEAARYDLLLTYDEEVKKLERVREVLQENNRSTLEIDAAEYDAQNKLIEQWDAAVAKVGTFSERFRGLMNEIALEGQNFSGKFFEAFHKGIDDAETQLAKFIVTGKANFKEVLQSMEESIVKAGIQKVVGGIGSAINNKFFGGAIPGLGNKADGSQASPFYVIPMDQSGTLLGGSGGGFGGILGSLFGKKKGSGETDSEGSGFGDLFGSGGNGDFGGEASGGDDGGGSGGGLLGGIFSKISGAFGSIFSSIGSVIGKIAGSIGSVFSSVFSFFGGFLASGGDVTPGKAYVVGEKHPEFFVPRQPGRVSPSLEVGGQRHEENHFHFYGVQDFDSFRKSRGQLMADMQMQLAIAHGRNK